MKQILLILILAVSVFSFDADSAGIPVMILHHRFDHFSTDTTYDTCNVIRTIGKTVWLGYYEPGTVRIWDETPYPYPTYQVIKIKEVCPWQD